MLGILIALSILLVALTFAPLWPPLLLAAVLASVSYGGYRRLSRLCHRPRLAALLMTAGVIVLILIPVSLIATVVVREAISAVNYVSDALAAGGVEELARRLPDRIERPLSRILDALPLTPELIGRQAAAGGLTLAQVASDFVAGASRALFALVMMLIAYFALLLDGARLVRWLEDLLGRSELVRGRARELFDEFRRVSRSVIGATLVSAIAQAAVAAIGYFIAGVPNAVFFACLTGFAALIPAIGTAIVTLPLAVLLVLGGDTWQGIFLGLYAVFVVSTVDNVVKPLMVRGSSQQNSALVFFSLMGGLLAFGPIGLLVGPLAVAIFLTLVRILPGT